MYIKMVHIFFRVIGQAATCIERSLGMKFSMENLKDTSFDENEDNSSGYSAGAAEEIRNRQMKRSRIVDIPNSSQFTQEQVSEYPNTGGKPN